MYSGAPVGDAGRATTVHATTGTAKERGWCYLCSNRVVDSMQSTWTVARISSPGLAEALAAGPRAAAAGFLPLGRRVDGSYYGWSFSRSAMADAAGADIIPDRVEPFSRGRVRLRAAGPGGTRYAAREGPGSDGQFLSRTDNAPQTATPVQWNWISNREAVFFLCIRGTGAMPGSSITRMPFPAIRTGHSARPEPAVCLQPERFPHAVVPGGKHSRLTRLPGTNV
jgi:hypothetical protein